MPSLRSLLQGPLPGYKIVADPSTLLLAACAAWKKVHADLADGFGASASTRPDWSPVERATVERSPAPPGR